MRKLVVIGMGYVGIPAAALFADCGAFQVVGLQRRSARSGWKIEALNAGRSPFPPGEPGMAELIRRVALEKRTFRVSDDFGELDGAEVVLIDVQTPVERDDHAPRYESLQEVARELGGRLARGTLVCVESTVAPGTTAELVAPLLERASGMRAGADFHLAFSYERVMVGRLLHNIRRYPRVVGGLTPACTAAAAAVYRHIVEAPVVGTDCLTAEVAKTVENAYRDVNIGFANEVALMCESLGIDVFEVRGLVNNLPDDPSNPGANPVRNMHLPGAGVGGHCLPKDSWLLAHGVERHGRFPVDSKVILGARAVNEAMPAHLAALALEELAAAGVEPREAKVAVLGYAFLEDSDDTRNTPAEPLIQALREAGVERIVVHDPCVRAEELPGVERELETALRGADCACVVTRHGEYRRADWPRLAALMRRPIVIDGRNLGGPGPGSGLRWRSLGVGERRPSAERVTTKGWRKS